MGFKVSAPDADDSYMPLRALAVVALVVASLPTLASTAQAEEYDPNLVFPVQGENRYSDTFDACRDGCSRLHRATDIMSPKMTPVVAAGTGTVGSVNWSSNPNNLNPERCCTLSLNHDDGWRTVYIHLNNDTPGTDDGQGWGFVDGIVPGTRLQAGEHFGYVGDSGNAENTGSHLHFELYDPDGNRINPYPWLLEAQEPRGLADGASARTRCDVNADGYDDLVVGNPDATIADRDGAGSVSVFLGTNSGLSVHPTVIHQDSVNVPGAVEAGDGFAETLACGDFDGDGFDDIVAGVPDEDIGSRTDAGYVIILYGSSEGPAATRSEGFSQATAGVVGTAEAGDRFGAALAAGDFNDDGRDDLLVGVPHEAIGSRTNAGGVSVLYGSPSGLTATGDRMFHQATSGVAGKSEPGDLVGWSVASGDFNGDGIDDAAFGAPGEAIGSTTAAGAVHVLLGSPSGLTVSNDKLFSQSSSGVRGASRANDRFGEAITSGDFDGDGYDDLAIGVPGKDIGSASDAGTVNVLYGSAASISSLDDDVWDKTSAWPSLSAQAGDVLGSAMAAGDFDNDGVDDLAIGSPGSLAAGAEGAGVVAVLLGSLNGLTSASAYSISSSDGGIGEGAGARYGAVLDVGDFDGDGELGLAIALPGEGFGSVNVQLTSNPSAAVEPDGAVSQRISLPG